MIKFSEAELDKYFIIKQLEDRNITQAEAGDRLKRSSRQVRRLLKRIKTEGADGIKSKHEDTPTNISRNFFETETGKKNPQIPTFEQIPKFVADMQIQINKCGNAGIEHEAKIMRKKGLLEEKDDNGKGPVTLNILNQSGILQHLKEIAEEAGQSNIDAEEE